MTIDEIKIRQMTNQYLIKPSEKLKVVRDILGVQAQFMGYAIHSLKIRCSDFTNETVADGLVKNWTIRSTVHVFSSADLGLFLHKVNKNSYRSDDWEGYAHQITGKWIITPERQRYFSYIILDSLKEGPHTREELKEICEQHGITKLEASEFFCPWGGGIFALCKRGFICYIVQEKKAYSLCPPFVPMEDNEACIEMVRRYFTHIAPATIKDAAYFFRTTQTQIKTWIDTLPMTSVECDGRTYYYIENGNTYNKGIPTCILLAGFDQLMLGYQKTESLYLPPEHLRGIFNLAGIVMPPILLNGRVVGKWQKKGTKLMFTLFESVSANDKKIITQTAESLWNDIKKIEWK